VSAQTRTSAVLRLGKGAASKLKMHDKLGGHFMSLIAIALLNGLLGATCGLIFRVRILIPLIAVACVQVAIFKQTGMWASAFWRGVALISAVELGYLIGSSVGTLWQSSRRGRILHELMTYNHGSLSPER
jgi:hypothetical protein